MALCTVIHLTSIHLLSSDSLSQFSRFGILFVGISTLNLHKPSFSQKSQPSLIAAAEIKVPHLLARYLHAEEPKASTHKLVQPFERVSANRSILRSYQQQLSCQTAVRKNRHLKQRRGCLRSSEYIIRLNFSQHMAMRVVCSHFFVHPAILLRNGEPQASPAELTAGCLRWLKASYSFLYVEVFSLILLFACVALWPKYGSPSVWLKYAISVASISVGICLFLQTMEFLKPGFLQKPVVGEHSSEKLCSVFLLLWWIIGTGIITFKGM